METKVNIFRYPLLLLFIITTNCIAGIKYMQSLHYTICTIYTSVHL